MARIVCVDDDPRILDVLQTILASSGHEVTGFVSSRECLMALNSDAFDVAVVDYEMPAPDGLELLGHIREFQPNCIRILASGKLEVSVVMDAVNRGEISRVVQKPFRMADIVKTVQDALSARQRMLDIVVASVGDDARVTRGKLEEVIAGNKLRLAMQPIVAVATRQVVAYECLLRPQTDAFQDAHSLMVAAERCGLVHEVADFVWREASEILRELPEEVLLFVNSHPLELCDLKRLQSRIDLAAHGSQQLVVEITERCDVLGVGSWSDAIDLLGKCGFLTAVDDLGSGYNSLVVLATLRPRFVKVDMSIVRGVDSDPRKQRLVSLLASFARSTEATLIAEGVETAGEAKALESCGADWLQGYYFGRPSLDRRGTLHRP